MVYEDSVINVCVQRVVLFSFTCALSLAHKLRQACVMTKSLTVKFLFIFYSQTTTF